MADSFPVAAGLPLPLAAAGLRTIQAGGAGSAANRTESPFWYRHAAQCRSPATPRAPATPSAATCVCAASTSAEADTRMVPGAAPRSAAARKFSNSFSAAERSKPPCSAGGSPSDPESAQ